MDDHDFIFADPWLKKGGKARLLPDDARFACAYEQDVVVDRIDLAAFFCRTETADELWIGAYETASAKDFDRTKLSDIGRVYAMKRKGDDLTACLKMMERFFRARQGFEWPKGFLVAGIVDESSFTRLVKKIEYEIEENTVKALEAETEIIKLARELGLSPKPTGKGPSYWYARCPGRNHVLFINAAENSFGCGWCQRNGAMEELREFVKEREDKKR